MYIILLYFFSTGFPSGGGGNPITNASPGGFKDAKHDLIAELKMSHTVGGVSKLRSEQQKVQEEQEREQYKRFLAQFTMENFLEKVNNAGDRSGEKYARISALFLVHLKKTSNFIFILLRYIHEKGCMKIKARFFPR